MLTDLLRKKRSRILADWTDAIFRGYPEQTARFLREQQDQFQNPVGYAVSREVPRFFDLLIEGAGREEVAAGIDRFLQIKSVQEPKSSLALAFIFSLKSVIRTHVAGELRRQGREQELETLATTIDQVALAAFDIYQGYREKILEIKANEIRHRSKLLLKRMNLAYGDEPDGTGCSVPKGFPDAPGSNDDAGERKGGNDR